MANLIERLQGLSSQGGIVGLSAEDARALVALIEGARQVSWKLSHNEKSTHYEGPGRVTRQDATVRMLFEALCQVEDR